MTGRQVPADNVTDWCLTYQIQCPPKVLEQNEDLFLNMSILNDLCKKYRSKVRPHVLWGLNFNPYFMGSDLRSTLFHTPKSMFAEYWLLVYCIHFVEDSAICQIIAPELVMTLNTMYTVLVLSKLKK